MPKQRFKKRVVLSQQKRPIDKAIIFVAVNLANVTQGQTQLYPTGGGGITFPGTITGLRWRLDYVANSGSVGTFFCSWAIVKLREGVTASNLNNTNGGTLYQPEQDVMVCSVDVSTDDNGQRYPSTGSTKTMRKLMTGDRLVLVAQDSQAGAATLIGFVEFFYKT